MGEISESDKRHSLPGIKLTSHRMEGQQGIQSKI